MRRRKQLNLLRQHEIPRPHQPDPHLLGGHPEAAQPREAHTAAMPLAEGWGSGKVKVTVGT